MSNMNLKTAEFKCISILIKANEIVYFPWKQGRKYEKCDIYVSLMSRLCHDPEKHIPKTVQRVVLNNFDTVPSDNRKRIVDSLLHLNINVSIEQSVTDIRVNSSICAIFRCLLHLDTTLKNYEHYLTTFQMCSYRSSHTLMSSIFRQKRKIHVSPRFDFSTLIQVQDFWNLKVSVFFQDQNFVQHSN